jgi:WD40 repeat protein
VNALALAADGSALYTGGADGSVLAWPLPLGALTAPHAFTGHSAAVTALALLGQRLVSASRDGTVCVRHTHDAGAPGAVLTPPVRTAVRAAALALSLTERLVAAAFADGAVHLWSGQPPHAHAGVLRCSPDVTGSLALTPDAAMLFSGGADGGVRAWPTTPDAHGRRLCAATLGEHAAAVVSLHVVVEGAGERVCAASTDGEVRVYAAARDAAGALRAPCLLTTWAPAARPRTRALAAAQLQPGGAALLFTASEDGAARAWAVPPAAPPEHDSLAPRAPDWLLCIDAAAHDESGGTACAPAALLAAGGADGRVLLWRVDALLRRGACVHAPLLPAPMRADLPSGTLPVVDLPRPDADVFPVPLREERAAARDAALREHDALRARMTAAARAEEAAAAKAAMLSRATPLPPMGTSAASPPRDGGWRGGYGLSEAQIAAARVYGPAAAARAALQNAAQPRVPLSAMLSHMGGLQLLTSAAAARWETAHAPALPGGGAGGGAEHAAALAQQQWGAGGVDAAATLFPPRWGDAAAAGMEQQQWAGNAASRVPHQQQYAPAAPPPRPDDTTYF